MVFSVYCIGSYQLKTNIAILWALAATNLRYSHFCNVTQIILALSS